MLAPLLTVSAVVLAAGPDPLAAMRAEAEALVLIQQTLQWYTATVGETSIQAETYLGHDRLFSKESIARVRKAAQAPGITRRRAPRTRVLPGVPRRRVPLPVDGEVRRPRPERRAQGHGTSALDEGPRPLQAAGPPGGGREGRRTPGGDRQGTRGDLEDGAQPHPRGEGGHRAASGEGARLPLVRRALRAEPEGRAAAVHGGGEALPRCHRRDLPGAAPGGEPARAGDPRLPAPPERLQPHVQGAAAGAVLPRGHRRAVLPGLPGRHGAGLQDGGRDRGPGRRRHQPAQGASRGVLGHPRPLGRADQREAAPRPGQPRGVLPRGRARGAVRQHHHQGVGVPAARLGGVHRGPGRDVSLRLGRPGLAPPVPGASSRRTTRRRSGTTP